MEKHCIQTEDSDNQEDCPFPEVGERQDQSQDSNGEVGQGECQDLDFLYGCIRLETVQGVDDKQNEVDGEREQGNTIPNLWQQTIAMVVAIDVVLRPANNRKKINGYK